uniref:IQ domain-containing protein IQM2-like n=1 Tax=Erigeron canadensis TaxID=72917 RepID=UPI001CB9297B|nr:IQ domain-containing protein IQM2-like [Erigeron canadensis]
MGLSISCLFADCADLGTSLASLSFLQENEAKKLVRSISFKRQDNSESLMKYVCPQENLVQESLTKKNESYPESPRLELSTDLGSPKDEAAIKLQKVYKSFRTRRKLADCAVSIEQSWWKVLESAELKRSSISFFDINKHESAISRWARARTRAAKVGKGLSKNCKAQKLALQHWLEAIDPRHRYGHNLQFYYLKWLHSESKEPFFYWLDIGEGKEVNLVEKCSRTKLQQQCIRYLGPMERKAYEVAMENGKLLYKQTGEFIDTTGQTKGAKWIFVLSTTKTLYVGVKKKGSFQHSSFLSGGATLAAGRIIAEKGVLKAVWPHSGHYLPTQENFQDFISFLDENDVDTSDVKMDSIDDDDKDYTGEQDSLVCVRTHSSEEEDTSEKTIEEQKKPRLPNSFTRRLSVEIPKNNDLIVSFMAQNHSSEDSYSDDEHEPDMEETVSKESIFQRIDSHKETKSFQLGRQLSCKWSTGAGPRIGCLRDYPTELQSQALEQENLSPRSKKSFDRKNSRPYRTQSSPLNTGSINLVTSGEISD